MCYLLSVVAQSRIPSLEEWRKVASNRPYFPFSGHVTRDFQIFQSRFLINWASLCLLLWLVPFFVLFGGIKRRNFALGERN